MKESLVVNKPVLLIPDFQTVENSYSLCNDSYLLIKIGHALIQ